MDLLERLELYSGSGVCPMHMPGHKRAELGGPLPWALDITEIDGFDNLHGAEGVLRESMDRAARLWGADSSFFLINGSTCGILAGICAAARPGDTVLLPRGCHKAVYHALELRGLKPVYLPVALDSGFGVSASLSPADVSTALSAHPEARLVVVTSPTYEGVVSDISAIAAAAHRHGVPLLVDEAHGAHLGFHPDFPSSAVRSGADMVIQSLHKTLPSLTQTAVAHLSGPLVDAGEFARQLSIFETSSPSYLLMGAMDRCVRLLENRAPALFSTYVDNLRRFDDGISGLRRLRVLCHGGDKVEDHPGFFAFDPGKLVISTRRTALTGPALMDLLRREHRIELEMALGDYALAMTSICDTGESLGHLAQALVTVDRALSAAPDQMAVPLPPIPPMALTPAEARLRPWETVPAAQAAGRISGEMVWAYPPGIPLLVPGEEITPALLQALSAMVSSGVRLHRDSGPDAANIRVLA